MKTFQLYFSYCLIALAANAAETRHDSDVLIPISAAVLSSALERADVAVARSVITPNLVKGDFAEGLTGRFILDGAGGSGKFQVISPRLGPQGLDHVAVRLDQQGRPSGLLVGETKYNSSQLGQTKAGIQMGPADTAKKLAGLASRLRDISKQGNMDIKTQVSPAYLNKRYQVSIPLDQKSSVTFWRDRSSNKNWAYDGPDTLLPKALNQLKLLADYIDGAAKGRITFRKRIFVWRLDKDKLLLTVKDATNLMDGMTLNQLPAHELPPIRLTDAKWAKDAFRSAYSNQILKKIPNLTESQALSLADEVFTTYSSAKDSENLLARRSFASFAGTRSLRAGIFGSTFGGAFEFAFQAMGSDSLNWNRITGMAVLSGASAATGSLAGDLVVPGIMKSQFGNSMAARTAQVLGVGSVSRAASAAGSAFGGGIASIVFAYGGYAMGYHDLTAANQTAIAGTLGAGGGALAYAGTLSLVAAYGTAGTGAAISSLSGAAATNASLALLGGGTAASGGGGMAAGGLVMGTGVGIVAVGVTVAVMYGFHLYDESEDNKRISLTLKDLSTR